MTNADHLAVSPMKPSPALGGEDSIDREEPAAESQPLLDRNNLPAPTTLFGAAMEVFRVALPLMVSTGMFSIVLFADRTLLMFYDGVSMSASMAGGNLFWVLVCVPVGAASMTGAVIGQLIGNNEEQKIGRLLWQSIWIALITSPWFVFAGFFAEGLFTMAGQDPTLIPAETTYLRWLMLGGLGLVIESALSGFFSGTERTSVIMWVSVASGLLNVVLDVLLIFGYAGFPALGITGAAIGSVLAFWFKVVCYAAILFRKDYRKRYGLDTGLCLDWQVLWNFVYFSLPSGLMYLTEASAFTIIVLKIGQMGDMPLRATTMAINFNMIAFIPLVGVAIATSVLAGRHLLQNGPAFAARTTVAALLISLAYSLMWVVAYQAGGDWLLSLYRLGKADGQSESAIVIAGTLLGFVSAYVVFDAVQLIIAAALKGAGDTWFVLLAGAIVSVAAVGTGMVLDDGQNSLYLWWWVITAWIWTLAVTMVIRFLGGRWKSMRMV
ncbi:MATE family efflux transporter [Roseiconus lacunae]|uniref:MATE family efflux transporter n=1 Tax=Roseiconus lacunae TaxID=2605694 RepID=UPI001E353588|nr:MATE family efflux transporter [Roseiconus lacunae]MCD0463374.1 MATE family efflux transporter [Roseiconus lacunae]WRQ48498.1 MATE family efflux transporter [Stieleria sp. HD01]